MTTDTPRQASIEVVAVHPRDAERAQEGGADRVHACVMVGERATSPDPATVSAIVRATDLPVRVTLRLSDGFTTQGGELTRLSGLAGDYLSSGAEGFTFGFLTFDLEADAEVCAALAATLEDAPWTFDRTFDHALDGRRAWRMLRELPGLDRVHSGGAALGMATGVDDLIAMARADQGFASAVVAAGGVRPEHVPWLAQAGIRAVHLGAAVRVGASWDKAHVDPAFVRSWRLLLDDEVARTPGPGV